jgi:metal-responsive CopG/Arc/MetJ family transcriptional regulator
MIKIVKSISMDVQAAQRINELIESREARSFSGFIQDAIDFQLKNR